jgi:hypothetical protein
MTIHSSGQGCRKLFYKTTIQVGNDAANETSLVSCCFLGSMIPQKRASGNDATTKIKRAMTPLIFKQQGPTAQ